LVLAAPTSDRTRAILEVAQCGLTRVEEKIVSMKISCVTTLLAAGAVTVSLVAAPAATAATESTCSTGVPGTECVTPGNAQLNDALAPDFESQYPDFSLFGFGRVGGRR
jgi:hypothetical protein